MVEDEETSKETDSESFSKYWGWFGVLAEVSNQDVTKMGEITKYPLTFILNYLTYLKDLNEIKQKELRKIKNQTKAIL
jgi:hypothetical protein